MTLAEHLAAIRARHYCDPACPHSTPGGCVEEAGEEEAEKGEASAP